MCGFSPRPSRPARAGPGARLDGRHRRQAARSPGTPSASTSTTCARWARPSTSCSSSATARSGWPPSGPTNRPVTARRAGSDGAPARRGARRGRLRLLHRARLRAQRLRLHRRAGRARAASMASAAGSTSRTSGARRRRSSRRRRKPSASARRAGCRCRSPTSRPRAARTGARWTARLRMIDAARARGVDVTGDVYPYPAGSTKMDSLLPGLDARRRHRQAPRAPGRSQGAAARDRRLPGGRRALAHRLGRHRLGRDHDRHVLPARAGRHAPRGAGPAHRPRARAGDDGPRAVRACRRLDGGFSQSEENVGTASPTRTPWSGSDSLSLHAGPGPHRRQAAPAELRDVPARARRLLPRAAALLVGDRGPQDDRHARGQAPA